MVNYDGIKFIGEGRCPVNHQSSSQQRWQFSLFISSRHGSNNFWHEIQCHVRHRASISNSQVLQLPNGSKIQDAQLRLWGHSSFNHQRKDGYFLKSIFGDRRMKQWPSENKVTAVCLIFFKEMQPSRAKDNPTGYQSQHMTKRTINVSYSSFGSGVILSLQFGQVILTHRHIRLELTVCTVLYSVHTDVATGMCSRNCRAWWPHFFSAVIESLRKALICWNTPISWFSSLSLCRALVGEFQSRKRWIVSR